MTSQFLQAYSDFEKVRDIYRKIAMPIKKSKIEANDQSQFSDQILLEIQKNGTSSLIGTTAFIGLASFLWYNRTRLVQWIQACAKQPNQHNLLQFVNYVFLYFLNLPLLTLPQLPSFFDEISWLEPNKHPVLTFKQLQDIDILIVGTVPISVLINGLRDIIITWYNELVVDETSKVKVDIFALNKNDIDDLSKWAQEEEKNSEKYNDDHPLHFPSLKIQSGTLWFAQFVLRTKRALHEITAYKQAVQLEHEMQLKQQLEQCQNANVDNLAKKEKLAKQAHLLVDASIELKKDQVTCQANQQILLQRLEETKLQNEQLQKQNENLQAELLENKVGNEKNLELEHLNYQNEQKNEISNLQNELQNKQNEIIDLEEKLTTLTTERNSLKARLGNLTNLSQTQIQALTSKLNASTLEYDELQSKSTSTIKQLGVELKQQSDLVAKLKNENVQLAQQNRVSQQVVEMLQQENVQLTKQNSASQADIERLSDQESEYDAKLMTATTKIETLEKNIQTTTQELQESKADLQSVRMVNQQNAKELDDMKKTILDFTTRQQKLDISMKKLNNELNICKNQATSASNHATSMKDLLNLSEQKQQELEAYIVKLQEEKNKYEKEQKTTSQQLNAEKAIVKNLQQEISRMNAEQQIVRVNQQPKKVFTNSQTTAPRYTQSDSSSYSKSSK